MSPKFTDKDGKVYEGREALRRNAEVMAEYFRPTIPDKPFDFGSKQPIRFTSKQYPPPNNYRELLTNAEKEQLREAVPELSAIGLEGFLRRIYNMGDERIKKLTWRDVLILCKQYVVDRNGGKGSAPPFEQTQKILGEFIEQIRNLEWSELLAKCEKEFGADKVKIIVNDIKTEHTDQREASDREQIEAIEDVKAAERLQRKCEYVRGLCKLTIEHKRGSPEAIQAANRVLELLPKIERGDYSLWREMGDTLFILTEALRANGEEAKAETDIVTLDTLRTIELMDRFCTRTEKLIDYIRHPDETRENSRTRAHTLGDQVNDLAQETWPHNNFDETGWPYESSDISKYADLCEGSIFCIEPELREQIIERLQQWKERALEDKSDLQKKLNLQRKQETQQMGSHKKDRQAGAKKETMSRTSGREIKPVRDHVFICYSRRDKRWLDELQTHLTPLVRNGSVTTWSDEQIPPGAEWFVEIKRALASIKVAVLLVTKDFIASEFIYKHELTPLLKKAQKGDVHIIWIPVGACSYKETPLKDYQAAADPDKPLAKMKKADRDEAWVRICKKIKKAVGR